LKRRGVTALLLNQLCAAFAPCFVCARDADWAEADAHMRASVLIRSWLSALFGFLAVTTAFCVALIVAITGPPSWAELRGVGDNMGAAFYRMTAFARRQMEAYYDVREPAPAPAQSELEVDGELPPGPPRLMAEAPSSEEIAPPMSDADDLAGGVEAPSPPSVGAPQIAQRAQPPRAAERAPRMVRPSPPPTASQPAPAQSVQIAPPMEPERASLTEQIMEAVEALIPTLEVREEAAKPAIKDSDPYADEPFIESEPPAPVETAHEAVRRRARAWSAPQPGGRFPADERDLERWRRQ
jgi:hypothetical protein